MNAKKELGKMDKIMADMLEDLHDDLKEAHGDEIRSGHHGDGAKGCIYCENMKRARKLIKQARSGK